MEGQGRRRKQLLADRKETRGSWKSKEEALVRTLRPGVDIRLRIRHKTDYRITVI